MNSSGVTESPHHRRKTFWDGVDASIDGMLQTENAEVISEVDTAEILNYLPDFKGQNALDLGAGIGRFTTELAKVAQHVTAVDISQSFLDQNQNNNKKFTNITYICKDVVQLDFPPGSFHFVFSSWILKYLTDEEVSQFISRVLSWLAPGGHFFFRESCFQSIGTVNQPGNPTIFRSLLYYSELLRSQNFRLLRAKNVQSYLQFQSAPNQVCFLAQRKDNDKVNDVHEMLRDRYSPQNIAIMEKIFASPWIYTGGEDTAKELFGNLQLRPAQRVLDVGCGTGNSAFFISRSYRAHVHGVDISVAAINLAIERQMALDKDLRKMVNFEIGDILEMNYEEGFFDIIYSRECFVYIANKPLLFSKLYRWLRPGGTVFFTDFLKGTSPPPSSFLDYLETIKPCFPMTFDSYKQALESEGFQNVITIDSGEEWMKILRNDLKIFESTREKFGSDVAFHDQMCDITAKKLEWIREKQLTLGIFRATK
ncbi:uncharacterized protein [Palaemon carinicauda]|uniref:uncharacterized protein n=1 Tax=Palaemon carinicauda TaxID=392227 RepID=UPI0035B64A1F